MIPALAAVAGVVVAHAVDYLVLFPSSGARDAYLHATGHGYWWVAVAAATAAAASAVVLVAGSAFRRAARGAGGARDVRLGSLLVWQMAAFVALEATERGLSGLAPGSVVHGRELWLGLLLQLPVAALVVWLLRGVDCAAAAVATRLRRPSLRPRRALPAPRPAGLAPRVLHLATASPRGPPG